MFPVLLLQNYLPSSSSKDIPLTVSEAFSGIFGSVSLACWMFLLLPQLIENYRNQSAEAISLAFLLVWFVGDVSNLAGALWAGLVPVVIAIGFYFCLSDGVLISQVLYYGIRNKRREGRGLLESVKTTVIEAERGHERERTGSSTSGHSRTGERSNSATTDERAASETSPLLSKQRTNSLTIPGSADPSHPSRRRSSTRRRSSAADDNRNDQLSKILEETDSKTNTRLWLKNSLSIFAIILIGSLGWLAAYESGAWTPTPPPSSTHKHPHDSPDTDLPPESSIANAGGAQFLGYLSAVLYLTARIPQIIKNYREKSCQGLSLLFFILSLLGNLTYGAGILCHSVEKEYFLTNLPWLIGSLGTMVEDVTIFVQFKIYDNEETTDETGVRDGEGESAII